MYISLLVLSVLIFAAAVVLYLRHPAASIFHPVTFYLAFHGLLFVIRPWFAWYYGYTNMYQAVDFSPTPAEKARVLICTNLGLIVFMAVALWRAREPLHFKSDAADEEEKTHLINWFWVVAIPLGLLGAYSMYWFWEFRLTGEKIGEVDTYTGYTALEATNGYFISAGAVLGSIAAIIAYLGRFRLWSLLPFIVFAVLRLGTGIRHNFVTLAVVIGLLFLFYHRKKWPSYRLVLPGLAIITAFYFVQLDRGAGIREAFGLDTRYDIYANAVEVDRKPLETMDLANMEFMEYLVGVVPGRTGTYDYFLTNLQLFVAPIPRALWEGKPVGAPIKMFELYRYGRAVGATYSVPGMGWYQLGYIGVVIWSALFALIYGTAYRAFAASRQGNIAVLAYCLFLGTAIIGFRDGTLMTIASQALFYFPPLLCLMLLKRFTGMPTAEMIRRGMRPLAAALNLPTPQMRRVAAAAGEASSLDAAPEPTLATGTMTPKQRRLAKINAA